MCEVEIITFTQTRRVMLFDSQIHHQLISLQRLEESTQLADRNYAKLKVESDRLEVHARKACNWWIWIMLIVVCATFLWMVIFMKMFPKR